MWWSRASSRGFDRTHDGALHELDLEVVVTASLRAVRGERRCRAERCRIETGSRERCLDSRDAPGLGSDAAEGDARLPDARPVYLERRRDGDERELEGGAVAHLEVMRSPRHRARRHGDGGDYLTRLEHRLEVGHSLGQPVDVGKRNCPLCAGAANLDGRIECDQRDGEVRSMRGDAALAGAEHRMPTILATDGGAAGSWRSLVASA